MLRPEQFKNLLADLLYTHRLLLLHGNLHKRVTTEAYNRNTETWNLLLLSLESGIVLGLQKILEKDDYFGREFLTPELNDFAKKTKKIRDKLIAHIDLAVVRDKEAFLRENQSTGSEVIKMITALKNRAIKYQVAYNVDINVHNLFVEATRHSMTDLDIWLKSFKIPL